MVKSMEREYIIITLEVNTRVNGLMIKNTGSVSWIMLMVTNTKEHGKTVREIQREFMSIQMETSMMVFGLEIRNKVSEFYKWLQVIDTKASGQMVKRMEMVILY